MVFSLSVRNGIFSPIFGIETLYLHFAVGPTNDVALPGNLLEIQSLGPICKFERYRSESFCLEDHMTPFIQRFRSESFIYLFHENSSHKRQGRASLPSDQAATCPSHSAWELLLWPLIHLCCNFG
jgi:hypothetical protein